MNYINRINKLKLDLAALHNDICTHRTSLITNASGLMSQYHQAMVAMVVATYTAEQLVKLSDLDLLLESDGYLYATDYETAKGYLDSI